ncbi:hypothetical protein M0R45_020862 [Rubus argutus]|uniref:3'-5' exonuclease domain-containing protein n=1 Tax=Rubus argutus TaxID=59490 RepID=A0AAW1XA27_RUBAR
MENKTAFEFDLGNQWKLYRTVFYQQHFRTIVTETVEGVENWLDDVYAMEGRNPKDVVVGLDAEWKNNDKVAVLQLAVQDTCLIFHIIHAKEIPEKLRSFLNDTNFIFVGVGVEADVQKLYDDWGLTVANFACLYDFRKKKYGPKDTWQTEGLEVMAYRYMRKDMAKDKNTTLSHWNDRNLTEAQVHYASLDAIVSKQLGNTFWITNDEKARIGLRGLL